MASAPSIATTTGSCASDAYPTSKPSQTCAPSATTATSTFETNASPSPAKAWRQQKAKSASKNAIALFMASFIQQVMAQGRQAENRRSHTHSHRSDNPSKQVFEKKSPCPNNLDRHGIRPRDTGRRGLFRKTPRHSNLDTIRRHPHACHGIPRDSACADRLYILTDQSLSTSSFGPEVDRRSKPSRIFFPRRFHIAIADTKRSPLFMSPVRP
jgi:hypothetical protein